MATTKFIGREKEQAILHATLQLDAADIEAQIKHNVLNLTIFVT